MPLAERRRIELACEWPPERQPHPLPSGDEHLLTVLLRNLLDNAVRYAPAGSTVTLRFGRRQLEVENDGAPLSPEQLARLGERFYRPTGQEEGGSGLGVSIVQRIAALHGLEVELRRGRRRRCGVRGRAAVRAARAGATSALIFSSRTRASSRRPASAICRPGRAGACSARSR